MNLHPLDYLARLGRWRRAVATWTDDRAGLPLGLVDQLDAAEAEMGRLALGLAHATGARVVWLADQRETTARIMTAVEPMRPCPHLTAGAPRPTVALLPLGIVACRACIAANRRRSDPADDDRCDWCGARGITTFTPMQLVAGHIVAAGDACPACTHALRVDVDEDQAR